ncbi:restriction endonuclease subunit S [Pontibacter sp. BT731]|uniref:restriction endonuclease subunit S n=1 Tax=Pontibacter coccineus TaxID=3063328 RepID=UPI0026E20736|nr:restriction endonuclease subunit S [Pontibacter sp. BT731]MDO6391875.1 restriction endonuclease subunit S [Pontibacter sp. BT731]
MMSNWITYKLSEVCVKIGSGATPKGGKSAYISEGITLIRSQNVLDFTFTEDGLAFINEAQAKALANVEVQERDVLINITGDSVSRVCQVPNAYLPARVNQHVAILRTNTSKLSPEFLKYSLLTKFNKDRLLSLASTGATRNALTKGMLEEFEILAHVEVSVQNRIAEILTALDDKIELNCRMNETLEQMAQTLFRKCFVDGIDEENQEAISLLDFANLIGGGTPKTSVSEYWDGDILWVSAKDVTPNDGTFIIATEKKITDIGLFKSSAKFIPQFSTIITARGTVGKLCIASVEMTISQSNYALKAKYKNADFVLFQIIQHQIEELQRNSYGTVFDTITTNTLRDIKITVPAQDKVIALEEKLKPLYLKIHANLKENITLSNTRDALLPKLISGEIDVMQIKPEELHEPVLS